MTRPGTNHVPLPAVASSASFINAREARAAIARQERSGAAH